MPARFSSPQLVGRDEVLASLTRAVTGALEGEPRIVVLRGEAGIGKTRLVREAITRLPVGTRALEGECLDIGAAGLPYLPIAEALRRLARSEGPASVSGLLGPARDDLAALVPELAQDAGPADPDTPQAGGTPTPSPPVTSGLAQARLFEGVLGLLSGLSAQGPVLLLVEDVHWIDRATRDLLTFLSRNLAHERLAVVLTVRDDDLPRGHPILAWLAEIERIATTTVLEPVRLDRADVERQLRLIAGDDVPADVADRIWLRSDGNPMFVEELYAEAPGDDGPRRLVDVLLARVGRLDGTATRLVEAAAVAGRPVDERLLADVLDVPESDLEEPLRAALAEGVLVLDARSERSRFRHELLREVVEGRLLPGARRRLHERFARRLEARPDLADPSPVGAAGELALHFAEAGLPDEAYRHSVAAAGAAEAVHAYADAHRHLERALALETRLAEGTPATGERVALRIRAADDADLAGDIERALELTREALALTDPVADPTAAGLLHSRVGYLLWSLGDGGAALASHEEAVRLVPAEPPTADRARVLGTLGGALMGEGRWQASRVVCETAIECARAADAPAEESRARNMLGSDLVALGEIDAGIAELREACRIAAIAGRPDMLIVGHHNLAVNLAAADRLDDAVQEARAGRLAARSAGLERRFGQDLAALEGDALTRLGRLDDADAAVAEGIALRPGRRGTVYLAAVQARLAGLRGDAGAAAAHLAGIDRGAIDPDVAALVAAIAAEVAGWEGRPADALAESELGLAALEGLDDVLWSMPLVALGLRAVAELEEGGRSRRVEPGPVAHADGMDRLRARLADLEVRVTTSSGRGWVAMSHGESARAAGAPDPAAWLAAIRHFDAVPDPLAAAYGRLRAAEAGLQVHGLRADVGDLLREAAAVAGRTGARPLADAVAGIASRARIGLDLPLPVAGPAPDERAPGPVAAVEPRVAAMALGLSAREVEVLELVTAGYTNGQIADRLFITRKTAGVHVTHILDKLGVQNRVAAAMVGARVGLAPAVDAGAE
jgi:DNA-binding CsgD family transcriptional regulator/tetratricopeptide (TPR) repeat protein